MQPQQAKACLLAATVHHPVVAVERQLVAKQVQQSRLGAVVLRPANEAHEPRVLAPAAAVQGELSDDTSPRRMV